MLVSGFNFIVVEAHPARRTVELPRDLSGWPGPNAEAEFSHPEGGRK
mgnify:CR=1 FL=1